jgi:hypothetical protein
MYSCLYCSSLYAEVLLTAYKAICKYFSWVSVHFYFVQRQKKFCSWRQVEREETFDSMNILLISPSIHSPHVCNKQRFTQGGGGRVDRNRVIKIKAGQNSCLPRCSESVHRLLLWWRRIRISAGLSVHKCKLRYGIRSFHRCPVDNMNMLPPSVMLRPGLSVEFTKPPTL